MRTSSPRITPPTAYRRSLLSHLEGQPAARVLVSPFLYEAMPCAKLPQLTYGVATRPDLLVDWVPVLPLTNQTSPWLGLSEIYDLERVPLMTAQNRGPFFIYRVVRDPRDAVAPARRSILS